MILLLFRLDGVEFVGLVHHTMPTTRGVWTTLLRHDGFSGVTTHSGVVANPGQMEDVLGR